MEGTTKRRFRHSHTKRRRHGINGPGTAQPSSSLLFLYSLFCSLFLYSLLLSSPLPLFSSFILHSSPLLFSLLLQHFFFFSSSLFFYSLVQFSSLYSSASYLLVSFLFFFSLKLTLFLPYLPLLPIYRDCTYVQVTQTEYMPFDPIVKRTEGSIKVSTTQHSHVR